MTILTHGGSNTPETNNTLATQEAPNSVSKILSSEAPEKLLEELIKQTQDPIKNPEKLSSQLTWLTYGILSELELLKEQNKKGPQEIAIKKLGQEISYKFDEVDSLLLKGLPKFKEGGEDTTILPKETGEVELKEKSQLPVKCKKEELVREMMELRKLFEQARMLVDLNKLILWSIFELKSGVGDNLKETKNMFKDLSDKEMQEKYGQFPITKQELLIDYQSSYYEWEEIERDLDKLLSGKAVAFKGAKLNMILKSLERKKGTAEDSLVRIKMILRDLSDEEMQGRYLESGKTKQEMLNDYQLNYDKRNNVVEYFRKTLLK